MFGKKKTTEVKQSPRYLGPCKVAYDGKIMLHLYAETSEQHAYIEQLIQEGYKLISYSGSLFPYAVLLKPNATPKQ